MNNTEIKNISEYVERICEIKSHCINNGADKNEILLFRGQAKEGLPLLPSLGRGRPCTCDITVFNQERNLIEMAKYKMPEVFRGDFEPIELLALLQHHGIPTRLLDITENALVALYFACISAPDSDGEIFAFKNNELDITNYPIVNGIADTYRFARSTFCDLDLFYGAIKDQPYFLEQKQTHEICHRDNKAGGRWVEECCKTPFFVYAPIKTPRQQAQQGRYILFPNKIEYYGNSSGPAFIWQIEEIPRDAEYISGIIRIPKEFKNSIIADLHLFGIGQDTLFCDSVDQVCESIVHKLTDVPSNAPILI